MVEQPGPGDQDWNRDDQALALHDLDKKLEEGLDVGLGGEAVKFAI